MQRYRRLWARCHLVPSAVSPLQGRDFAAALQRGGLGLGPVDVAGLVAGVQDGLGAVDYRTVASKLWGKLQLGQAAAAGGSSGGAGSPCTRAAAPAAPAAQPSLHLPQFVRARQRRLQTNVALALGQQPEALAREAAEVAALPGFLPWKQAEAAQGKRTAYDRPAEFGGAGAGANKFCFADGDPRAAQVGGAAVRRACLGSACPERAGRELCMRTVPAAGLVATVAAAVPRHTAGRAAVAGEPRGGFHLRHLARAAQATRAAAAPARRQRAPAAERGGAAGPRDARRPAGSGVGTVHCRPATAAGGVCRRPGPRGARFQAGCGRRSAGGRACCAGGGEP